jgi:hypothetical protein
MTPASIKHPRTLSPVDYPSWVQVGTKFQDHQGTWRIAKLKEADLTADLHLLDGTRPRNKVYHAYVADLIQSHSDQMLEIVRIGGAA